MLQNPYHFQEFLKNKLFDNSKKLLGLNHKAVIFLFKQLEHPPREEDLQQKQPCADQKQPFADVLQNGCF